MTNQANGDVAIMKYEATGDTIEKGIDAIDGFAGLKTGDRVLIKPNIVWSAGGVVPKYGLVTTSRIIEDLIILLQKHGCRHIAIGEGSPVNDEMRADTLKAFEWSGLAKVARKHKVELIDFNEDHVKMKLGKSKISVARAAVEVDFLINVPVLKTHGMTKVSLGMKNLKGCLSMNSKRIFHMLDLNELIALLNTRIQSSLTVIDGIYGLERGPLQSGRAHRMNVLLFGKDIFSCDVVGSAVLGIDPSTVGYLGKYAQINQRSLDIEAIPTVGEKIENVSKPMAWRTDFENFFRRAGIGGVTVQWPGDRFCTNCVFCAGVLFTYFCKDNPGLDLDPVEICFGADVKAKADSQKVMLVGNCAIRANKDLRNAVRVEGCPPPIIESLKTLMDMTLEKKRVRRILAVRFIKMLFTKLGMYQEKLPRSVVYDLPDFDPKFF